MDTTIIYQDQGLYGNKKLIKIEKYSLIEQKTFITYEVIISINNYTILQQRYKSIESAYKQYNKVNVN